jgi:hypothetical protein
MTRLEQSNVRTAARLVGARVSAWCCADTFVVGKFWRPAAPHMTLRRGGCAGPDIIALPARAPLWRKQQQDGES